MMTWLVSTSLRLRVVVVALMAVVLVVGVRILRRTPLDVFPEFAPPRVEIQTDWEHLQRPGFSPDFLHERYERMDSAYERTDWVDTAAAKAMYRNNHPLLAYLGGKPESFTNKDHNFLPGETIKKQIIVINNSRVPVTCDAMWSMALHTIMW